MPLDTTSTKETMLEQWGSDKAEGERGDSTIIASKKSFLINAPAEIHLMIFNLLDRASSTCLGLTSSSFYAIHWSLRGKVPLGAWCVLPPNRCSGKHLYSLLREWIGPDLGVRTTTLTIMKKEIADELNYTDAISEDGPFKGINELIEEKERDETEMGGCYIRGKWVENGHRQSISFFDVFDEEEQDPI